LAAGFGRTGQSKNGEKKAKKNRGVSGPRSNNDKRRMVSSGIASHLPLIQTRGIGPKFQIFFDSMNLGSFDMRDCG
jgi:hypothetical protein